MTDVTNIMHTPCSDDYVTWLKELAEKGGNGVVNNIEALALAEVANTIELQGHIIRSSRTTSLLQDQRIQQLERLLAQVTADAKGYI